MRTFSVLLLFAGCSDPYGDAIEVGTIEALEAFAQAHPDHRNMFIVKAKLEGKYYQRALDARTVEAYDDYLTRYPEAERREKAEEERHGVYFRWAEDENTGEAWAGYAAAYPRESRNFLDEAARRIKMSEHAALFEWSEVQVEPANMAEDPEGPYNGYLISAEVTFTGERVLEELNVQVDFLGEGSVPLHSSLECWPMRGEGRRTHYAHRWPLLSRNNPQGLPIEEAFKVPMQPGETRAYHFLTEGPSQETWERRARLTPVSIRFEGDTSDH